MVLVLSSKIKLLDGNNLDVYFISARETKIPKTEMKNAGGAGNRTQDLIHGCALPTESRPLHIGDYDPIRNYAACHRKRSLVSQKKRSYISQIVSQGFRKKWSVIIFPDRSSLAWLQCYHRQAINLLKTVKTVNKGSLKWIWLLPEFLFTVQTLLCRKMSYNTIIDRSDCVLRVKEMLQAIDTNENDVVLRLQLCCRVTTSSFTQLRYLVKM